MYNDGSPIKLILHSRSSGDVHKKAIADTQINMLCFLRQRSLWKASRSHKSSLVAVEKALYRAVDIAVAVCEHPAALVLAPEAHSLQEAETQPTEQAARIAELEAEVNALPVKMQQALEEVQVG